MNKTILVLLSVIIISSASGFVYAVDDRVDKLQGIIEKIILNIEKQENTRNDIDQRIIELTEKRNALGVKITGLEERLVEKQNLLDGLIVEEPTVFAPEYGDNGLIRTEFYPDGTIYKEYHDNGKNKHEYYQSGNVKYDYFDRERYNNDLPNYEYWDVVGAVPKYHFVPDNSYTKAEQQQPIEEWNIDGVRIFEYYLNGDIRNPLNADPLKEYGLNGLLLTELYPDGTIYKEYHDNGKNKHEYYQSGNIKYDYFDRDYYNNNFPNYEYWDVVYTIIKYHFEPRVNYTEAEQQQPIEEWNIDGVRIFEYYLNGDIEKSFNLDGSLKSSFDSYGNQTFPILR